MATCLNLKQRKHHRTCHYW